MRFRWLAAINDKHNIRYNDQTIDVLSVYRRVILVYCAYNVVVYNNKSSLIAPESKKSLKEINKKIII